MKTSLIVAAAVIILHAVAKAEGEEKFECPVDCPPNVYRPICSRGKSYANLCILKRQICNGKTAREVYDDVEDCPRYDKEDDANGKSVETVDANGVIFRYMIDAPTRITSYRPTKDERQKKIRHRPCLFQGQAFLGSHTLGKNVLQTMPLFFMGNCQTSSNELSPISGDETSIDNQLNDFADIPVIENISKDTQSLGARVDPIVDTICQINCDPEEYRPICAGEQAFRSECYLRKAFCFGTIGRDDFVAAKTCPPVQSRGKRVTN